MRSTVVFYTFTFLLIVACSMSASNAAFSQYSIAEAAATEVDGKEDGFGYCTVKIGSSTELKEVVSSVFRVKAGTYHIGVQNSFRDYVSANYDDVSSPTCHTTIETYQEAADDRSNWIAKLRRDRWTVFTVNWSYRGD